MTTKYMYLNKTWTGTEVDTNMMTDLNTMGSQGWKVIKLVERPWMHLTSITAYFELTYQTENE